MTGTFTLALHLGPRTWPLRAEHERIERRVSLGIFATWRKRFRFRRHLERLSKDGPQLIEDIGLTMAEVEAELQKPFWQA